MEEDDPVVKEIPVFLSKSLSDRLYVFQYPVKPATRNWKDVEVVNAKIKPTNNMVRLEVGLDTYSEKYCSSKGEQISINTDGMNESKFIKDKEKEKSKYFKNDVMDKIVYESCVPVKETGNYAVGILQDNELHITPIKGILQMRPVHTYFDKQEVRKSEKNKSEETDEDEAKEPEVKPVTVKFARQETEVAKKAREKSYETLTQKIAQEPWYDGLWKHSDSDYAQLERLKLFSSSSQECSMSLSPAEYIRCLVPAPPSDEVGLPETQLPSLQTQIKELLISARVLRFDEIARWVRGDPAGVLAALSGAATCVRGVWTARSEDLYTRAASVPALAARAARDHVLYLFTKHQYIDRQKVTAAVRLPPASVLEIIQTVAKHTAPIGWELIIPADTEFESQNPDIVQRHLHYLEAKQRQFDEALLNESFTKRQRKKSQREGDAHSPRLRCNSASEEDVDKKRKSKSATGVGKRSRNVSSSSGHEAS